MRRAVDSLDPQSLLQIEVQIRELNRALVGHTTRYGEIAQECAELEAEVESRKTEVEIAQAHATLEFRGRGTVPEIRALVVVATEAQMRELAQAQAEVRKYKRLVRHVEEAGHNIRTQLEALRSINANARHLAGNAPGWGS